MKNPLRRLGYRYAAPQWRWYLSGIVALIVTNIIVLEIPQLAKQIINALAAGQDLTPYSTITFAIITLGLMQVLIRTASRMLIFWPGRTLEAAIKDDTFSHVLRAPMTMLVPFSIGDLTSRLNNDVTQLRIFFAFGALQVLNVIFISLFTVTKMASIDPILTTLAISPMLPMLLLTKMMMPKLYKAMRDSTEATGRLTGKISETFAQTHIIQMMNAQKAMLTRVLPENEAIYSANLRTVWIRTLIWPVMIILIGISQFMTLAWGGQQIIAQKLTVGDIMAFNIYIGMLTFPFASLGIILNVYQRAKPAAERLEDLSGLPTENEQVTTAEHSTAEIKVNRQLLLVQNLSFNWPDGRICLENINFSINAGQRVGIFGSIGSGKSTLFNIITRLAPQTSGDVYLFGQNTKDLSPAAVRQMIAYGQQQPLLFSESIRTNLCLGMDDQNISTETLTRVTKQAQVYDDIMRMPDTWDTLIGERGIKLSGGQKQRLALARLLLRPADLIILDDVLSAVDHDTEHRLIESLLTTKSALLIASHRVSILEPCDKILIFKEGRIAKFGTFPEVRDLIDTITRDEKEHLPRLTDQFGEPSTIEVRS
jgi:ATP-binding cassette subfamily B multidrug efflux pump